MKTLFCQVWNSQIRESFSLSHISHSIYLKVILILPSKHRLYLITFSTSTATSSSKPPSSCTYFITTAFSLFFCFNPFPTTCLFKTLFNLHVIKLKVFTRPVSPIWSIPFPLLWPLLSHWSHLPLYPNSFFCFNHTVPQMHQPSSSLKTFAHLFAWMLSLRIS